MQIEGKRIAGRVECLGKSRDAFETRMNQEYGQGNWGYGWLVEILDEETGEYVPRLLDKEAVISHYLNAYILLATRLPYVFPTLIDQAAEVFELDPETDLVSGTDFHTQESVGTHYMDIAIRNVLELHNITFRGNTKVNINHGGDQLPEELKAQLAEDLNNGDVETWFDVFNPSRLPVGESIRVHPEIDQVKLLTDPCPEHWAERTEGPDLTAESLYQFARVVWVKAS